MQRSPFLLFVVGTIAQPQDKPISGTGGRPESMTHRLARTMATPPASCALFFVLSPVPATGPDPQPKTLLPILIYFRNILSLKGETKHTGREDEKKVTGGLSSRTRPWLVGQSGPAKNYLRYGDSSDSPYSKHTCWSDDKLLISYTCYYNL